MLYLKEANFEDIEKEFAFITALPENENGFTNQHFCCKYDEFEHIILPRYIDYAKGLHLSEGHVPSTEIFLFLQQMQDTLGMGFIKIIVEKDMPQKD